MKHKIMMISGKQGSGKTTLMKAIQQHMERAYDVSVKEIRFAQTIYDIHDYARELLRFRGVARPDKDGPFLQMLGTEWGRNQIHPNIWVDCAKGEINNIAPEPREDQLFIVSDCRFRNEFDGLDAFKVRLEAGRDVRRSRADSWRENDEHPSEVDLDEYAREGYFNCYVDTELAVQTSVSHILKRFDEYMLFDQKTDWEGFRLVKGKYYE